MEYKVLALGDVASETGLQLLEKKLRAFKKEHDVRFTVVNGENISGSGLTRQTFYRNFLDKYDLINWYFDKLVLKSFEQIGVSHTIGESLTQKLEFIQEEKAFFTEAFRSDDRNSVKEHDFELILQFYKDLIARRTSRPLGEELQFLLEMYCQGSVFMTTQWVLGNKNFTPQELAGLLADAMPKELADVFREVNLI